MQLNWLFSVAYASWYKWICDRTQRKAATINQFACPSYSLYVQCSAALVPNVLSRRDEGSGKPCAVIEASYSILASTQDSNPGGRIQNHKRWPLPYTTAHCGSIRTHGIPRYTIFYDFWRISENQTNRSHWCKWYWHFQACNILDSSSSSSS